MNEILRLSTLLLMVKEACGFASIIIKNNNFLKALYINDLIALYSGVIA